MPASPPPVLDAHVDRLILIGDEMRPLATRRSATAPGRPRRHVDEATDVLLRMLAARRRGAGQGVQLGRACEAGRARGRGSWHALPDRRAARLPRHPQPHSLHQLPRRRGERDRACSSACCSGPWFIRWLRAKQGKGQPIRADGPQSHLAKRGTPTMGGLLILISVSISVAAVDGPHQPLRLGVPAGHRRLRPDRLARRLRQGQEAHHAGLSGKIAAARSSS